MYKQEVLLKVLKGMGKEGTVVYNKFGSREEYKGYLHHVNSSDYLFVSQSQDGNGSYRQIHLKDIVDVFSI